MHTNLARWTLALASAALLPGVAQAQSIPSSYRYLEKGQEATVFAGSIDPERGRFGFGLGPGVLFGGRYAVELSGPLALEGVTSLFSATRNVVNPARDEGDRVIGEVDATVLAIDARMRFSLTGRRTWRRINPYVFVGGGFAFDMSGTQELDLELEPADRFDLGTELLGAFGVGFRYVLTERFAIRTDLAVNMYRLNTPSGFSEPDRGFTGVAESEWVNARTLSIGLAYLF